MSALTLDWRGTVMPDGKGPEGNAVRARLRELAEQHPVGSRVVHACGRQGTVAVDQPQHVPGLFTGEPSAVCLAGKAHDQPMVFVHWDNDSGLTWGVWVRADKIRRSAPRAANRPSNKARIGGR
ncbi:hypothetical protein [Streptomyces sp. NPDC051452]|uniref:hypothetical protein n=1 Tax=Streptomyces sp. NPDC051452 TaxID=3365654 RepID=UPI0037B9700F